MKYLFVTLIFSFTFGLVSAQNNSPILPTLQKYSNKVYVGNVSVDNVQKYLQQHQPHLMQPNVSLQWQQTQQSPLGTHYTFVQQYKGMPIYGTSIKATINKSNYLVLIMDNTFDVSLLKHPITPNFTTLNNFGRNSARHTGQKICSHLLPAWGGAFFY